MRMILSISRFTDTPRVRKMFQIMKNVPDNTDGQILTFVSVINTSDPPVIQFAVTQTSVFYIRTKWYANEWSSWEKII